MTGKRLFPVFGCLDGGFAMPLEHDGGPAYDRGGYKLGQVGVGRAEHVLRTVHAVTQAYAFTGMVCPSTCPARSPCKRCTMSAGPLGRVQHCSCYSGLADHKTRPCPHVPIAGKAWCSFPSPEPSPVPPPTCWHPTALSRRLPRVAGDCTAWPSRPLTRWGRRTCHPRRQDIHSCWDTWHSQSRPQGGSCQCPGRGACGCRWLLSHSLSSGWRWSHHLPQMGPGAVLLALCHWNHPGPEGPKPWGCCRSIDLD